MGDDKIYSCDVRNDPSQRKVLHMKRGEGLTEGKRRRPGSGAPAGEGAGDGRR